MCSEYLVLGEIHPAIILGLSGRTVCFHQLSKTICTIIVENMFLMNLRSLGDPGKLLLPKVKVWNVFIIFFSWASSAFYDSSFIFFYVKEGGKRKEITIKLCFYF